MTREKNVIDLGTLDLTGAFAVDANDEDLHAQLWRSFGDAKSSPVGDPWLDPQLPATIFAEGLAPSLPQIASMVSVDHPDALPRGVEVMPAPGAIVDKYRLEELIGVGGFGTVYRATHLLLGTQVALKMLKASVAKARPKLAASLCAEARLAAQIDNENVVRILDVTHNDAITYVVMEYIDGRPLSDALSAEGVLSLDRVLRLGLDVTEGLAAGLKRGVIHRDVKPANILLTRSGRAKLVDFGLAVVGAQVTSGPAGTPGYMAPEQGKGEVDHRADIFALGVTLYQALTGLTPIAKASQKLKQWTARLPPPTPLDQVRPTVGPAVSNLIMGMMAPEREKRPSYELLIRDLKLLIAQERP